MTAVENPKLLIVDDHVRNLDALEAMLAPLRCDLVRALSADEALLCLLKHDFAAIVLDIRMPGMSGIELAKLIKQRKRSQAVPLLFLTAHLVDENDVLQGYGVGAVDYLSKPINPEILRSKVGVFLDLYRHTRALAALNETLEHEVGERERAQRDLEAANQQLEQRVAERTAALVSAHEGVRENEERLLMAMEVGRFAAWEWDVATGHMTWSSDPEVLFGFPRGAFGAELRMSRALHPDDRPAVDHAIAFAHRSGTYEAEYRLVRPDGQIVWVRERGRVVHSPGRSLRMIGVSHDRTAEHEAAVERERLLQSARQARDEAERQSRLKDEFLATLSHELRTPMNAMLGWLSILDTGKPIRDVYSALSVIRRNAEIQAKLIDDLLDMNRLVSGRTYLEIAPTDVGVLAQGALQALQPAADAKGVRLICAVDSSIGAFLVDARRMQQVLWNLVHNGIKFTPSGGRVEIHVRRTDGNLQIIVQDTGQGISHDFLPHVFERFRQEDASTARGTFGLGLGLSIAKHLVELHGGAITAFSSGTGRGARFEIEIPAATGSGSEVNHPTARPAEAV